MKISVVTITADGAGELSKTMASVHSQTHKDIEHLAVDGFSNDGTTDVVAAYPRARLYQRERKGLYDALNHGLHLATGDVVGMVHCGDVLASQNVLAEVAEAFERDAELDFLYGDMRYFNPRSGRRGRIYHAGNFIPAQLTAGMTPPHPTLYVRRHVIERVGDYALDYYIGADIEMWIRLFTDTSLKYRYLPMVMVEMATGGRSTSFKGRLYINNVEKLKALRAHGLPANPLCLAKKYWWTIRDIFLDLICRQ